MALLPAGGRNKKDRLRGLFFSCGFSKAPTGLPVKGCGARGLPPPLASRQSGASELRPPTSCLPCVRGGAERMRSGGVVGRVQEKAACNRKPVPIRYPQPLSQGLSALPAPLFDRGRFCGNAGRHRAAGRARSDGRNHVPPVNPPLFGRKTRDESHAVRPLSISSLPLTPSPTGGRPAGAAAPGPSGNNTRRRAGW